MENKGNLWTTESYDQTPPTTSLGRVDARTHLYEDGSAGTLS